MAFFPPSLRRLHLSLGFRVTSWRFAPLESSEQGLRCLRNPSIHAGRMALGLRPLLRSSSSFVCVLVHCRLFLLSDVVRTTLFAGGACHATSLHVCLTGSGCSRHRWCLVVHPLALTMCGHRPWTVLLRNALSLHRTHPLDVAFHSCLRAMEVAVHRFRAQQVVLCG